MIQIKLLTPLLEIKTYLYGFIIFNLSCTQLKDKINVNNSETKVITSEYTLHDSIQYEIELTLEKIIDNDKAIYIYRQIDQPDSSTNHIVTHNTKTDRLTYYNDSCSFINYKTFSAGDKSYKILKFSNNSSIADDATNFYLVKDYGLIAIRSIDWGNYYTFNNGLKSDSIVILKLINDANGFFKTSYTQ